MFAHDMVSARCEYFCVLRHSLASHEKKAVHLHAPPSRTFENISLKLQLTHNLRGRAQLHSRLRSLVILRFFEARLRVTLGFFAKLSEMQLHDA